ncbi:hypothetical protein DFJ74DRAFT_763741 [Hyaloraphidium curvatum]|nr:hypothetical protein DFJ74DRAFT_763741 [Hyaloraphidium curvatum]
MAPPARHALAALAALLLLVAGAAAGPVAGGAALFRRSCADCSDAEFCEFAYPGTPADHVACVAHSSARSLYRRYAAGPTTCPGRGCTAGTGQSFAFNVATPAACLALCTGSCTVADWEPEEICIKYASCTTWVASGGSVVYVKAPSTCPA